MMLEDVDKPRIEQITRMRRSVIRLVAILRFVAQSPNRGRFGLNYPYDSGNGQSAKCSPSIPLDFGQYTADTSVNTLTAPLFRQVKCPRNDVHNGRVPFSNNARFELHRITAAPPLMPVRHNAVLGRLLLFTHSLLGSAASWATKATLNCCDGQSHTQPRIERITRTQRSDSYSCDSYDLWFTRDLHFGNGMK